MSGRIPGEVLEAVAGRVGAVRAAEPLGGGCIANATRLETNGGRFFLKWAVGAAAETFDAEAAGLRALGEAPSPLLIPEVLSVRNGDGRQPGHLLLEWIEPGRATSGAGRRLGSGLAMLHSHTEPNGRYGFDRDNFIGRLPQVNGWRADWPTFFHDHRLAPQIEMARQRGAWQRRWDPLAEGLMARLAEILPTQPPPAICHGDLWTGNVVWTASGDPALVDPAAYFGHAETDLAMMTLFGGFGSEVFAAYHDICPRQPGHDDREKMYQLYHLLSHLNHFGGGYAGGVERALKSLQ